MTTIEIQQNRSQICRVDARNCFVESLSDYFRFGKFHLGFTGYDKSRPAGSRQTARVNYFLDVGTFLMLTEEFRSGKLAEQAELIRQGQRRGDLFSAMSGTEAHKLQQPRADGFAQSRTISLTAANKPGFYLMTATSGAGVRQGNGIIAPASGRQPDSKVSVLLSPGALGTLLYVSETHYRAWLTACYSERAIRFEGDPAQNGWNPYNN